MGLKWFRARLTLNGKPKKTATTSLAGFYRSLSKFDSPVELPQPSYSQEPYAPRNVQSFPILSESIAYNPMAGLNNSENKMSEVPTDIVSSPRKTLEIGKETRITSNEELETPDDAVPRNFTRESIELMRDVNVESSPKRIGSRSRKIDFKKKKARAPIPKMMNNSAEGGGDGERFVKIDKGRGSDASEIEI